MEMASHSEDIQTPLLIPRVEDEPLSAGLIH